MSIDISNVYPNQDLKVDLKTRQPPLFVGDGSAEFATGESAAGTYTNTLNSTLSMCCWVKVYDVSQTYFMDIGVNSSKAQISISYHNGTGAGVNKRPYIWNGSAVIYATQEMEINEWHHLAVTSAPGAGNIKIYLDGVDVTPSHSTDVTITTNNIYLGKWIPISGNFNGKMANAALFRTTLTQEQVRECMRASSFSQFDAISTLEAFYPLDANFNDSTSGGHNLTATGSPSFTVDRPQLPRGLDFSPGRSGFARSHTGRAVNFDGSADYLLGDSSLNGAADLSYSVWVNLDATSGTRTIVGENADVTIYLYNNKIGVWNLWGTIGAGEYAEKQATDNAPTGQWIHIGVSYTYSSNTIKLYIDGVDQPTVPSPVIGPGSTSGKIEIGARDNGGSPLQFLDGRIAGVKRFDVALTQDQIRELYHNPEQVLPTGVSASNLRRYYPLSDYNDTGGTGGRYFQDMGADGEPAEDKGSALMAFGQSVPCPQLGLQQSATRLLFPGGGTTHNAVATTAALGTNASVSCWFQANNISSTQIIWAIGNTAGTGFFEAFISGNAIYIFGQSSNITVAGATEGAWTHLVVTTDSGSPPYKAYVNGAEVSLTGTDTARNFTNGTFEIGNQDVAYSPYVFNGIINDIACWNTELSLSDVQSLYNSGVMGMDISTIQSSNLKGWWKCDDLTSFKDYSGNGANATVTNTFNAVSFPENASGSTIVGDFSMKRKGDSVFNFTGGGDSRLELPANPDILPAVSGGYTFSAFVRLQTTGSDQAIMMSSATGVDEWGTYYNSSNNKYYVVMSNGSSNISDRAFTNTVTDSEWHHIAWTLDLSQEPAVGETYLDGVSDTSFTRTGMNTPPAASSFGIGYDPGNSNKEAFAAISSLKIYQRVLSADEIKSVYLSDERMIRGNKNE